MELPEGYQDFVDSIVQNEYGELKIDDTYTNSNVYLITDHRAFRPHFEPYTYAQAGAIESEEFIEISQTSVAKLPFTSIYSYIDCEIEMNDGVYIGQLYGAELKNEYKRTNINAPVTRDY